MAVMNRDRSENEKSGRLLLTFFLTNIALVVAAALFFLLPRLVPLLAAAGCPTHDLLHLYCPFCGGTRATLALLHGKLATSFALYPPLLPGCALVLVFEIVAFCRALKGRAPLVRVPIPLVVAVLVLMVLFTVARNLLMIFRGIDPVGDLIGFWQ